MRGEVMGKVGSKNHVAAHATLGKYQLVSIGAWWKARVPYGTWRIFYTWEEGRDWLAERHGEREAKRARVDSLARTLSTPNERQERL
jgi:hypothetical protein